MPKLGHRSSLSRSNVPHCDCYVFYLDRTVGAAPEGYESTVIVGCDSVEQAHEIMDDLADINGATYVRFRKTLPRDFRSTRFVYSFRDYNSFMFDLFGPCVAADIVRLADSMQRDTSPDASFEVVCEKLRKVLEETASV